MGQKVNPNGIRLGIIRDWNSQWYANKKDYAAYLNADLRVRKYLLEKLPNAGISKIEIKRPSKNAFIKIHAARPGTVIGKKGGEVDEMREEIKKLMDGVSVHINIVEIRKPELDAQLAAMSVAQQLERRVMFRRAMKRAVQNAMKAGALGIKVTVSGRLGGTEIARTEWYREGRVPLHTFRADIDYATAIARTTYGVIGVKVWIFKGEVLSAENESSTVKE
jgi:small subunit ribosomal protein S3